ncbi:DUF896 domain-containing protein [[Acholeplasma] multilocale]|uniref:DUF896 domain-containing protein n=1 Tax=[Acholeplasma] multilocale TaxID=264638 RepID=UPI00041C9A91|nr:DUF896 domain-containing protein [[Acholeplasma] multilocale]
MLVKDMQMPDVIAEINRLAAIKKERPLDEVESSYREELKQRYLELYREGFVQQLKSLKVVNEQGEDITPAKLKELKEQTK